MASVALETSALKINASNIKSNLISSNKKIAKLRVQKIKLIDTIQKESIRKRVEKKIESPIKGITPVLGGAFSKLAGMMRPIKDKFLDIFGTLLLAFAIDKLPKIIQTLTSAYEKVKPVWTVATKTLRTIFDGIVSLKPFADKVYNFSKNTFQDISNKTKQLTGIELDIDDDLKVFDDFFGEPKDDGLEPPKQEQEKNIFNGFSGLFSRSTQNKKDQNKNKIKTQTSDKRTELTQVAIDYQKILKGYVRKGSTAGTSTQSPTPTSAPSPQSASTTSLPATALNIVSKMGFSKSDFGVFKNVVANIESGGRYDIKGGSGNHYDGKYQLGAAAKTDAARYLGVPDPGHGPAARERFRKDPQMQENFFAAFTLANHTYLMGNRQYANASPQRKLQILGYAHNQGMGGAEKWITTGVVGVDGFGTKGTKYTDAIRDAFVKRERTNVTPIRQNRSIPQSSGNSSGGNRTLIVPFGIETLVPMFQGVSESEVNSTTQRRLQRRANNLP